jgi:signal transduction histidine kinase
VTLFDARPATRPASTPRTRLRLVLGASALGIALGALLGLLLAGTAGLGSTGGLVVAAAAAGLAVSALLLAVQAGRAHREDQAAAQQTLQQQRARLELLELLPMPLALWDDQFGRAQLNGAMLELFGLERGAGVDRPWDWQTLVDADDWPAWQQALAAARQSGRAQWLQLGLRSGGAESRVLARIAPWMPADTAAPRWAVVLQWADDAATQQVVLRLQTLLEMAEAEQWRFGQAVHDELGQRLSGMAFFAKALQRKLAAANRLEAADAGWLTDLANETMAVARDLARGLVPVGSDDQQALATMLDALCDKTARMFDVQCALQADPRFDAGGRARANHLYHAVQELITNAIKHGGARRVQVVLAVDAQGQRVSVRNDGRHLAATPRSPLPGMGLNGVRSRVAHLEGRFVLSDDAAGGVLALIELPPAPVRPADTAAPEPVDEVAGPDDPRRKA